MDCGAGGSKSFGGSHRSQLTLGPVVAADVFLGGLVGGGGGCEAGVDRGGVDRVFDSVGVVAGELTWSQWSVRSLASFSSQSIWEGNLC